MQATRSGFALVLALTLLAGPAAAEIGSARRPASFLSPGASLELGLDGSLRFGGEVALAQYSGGFGLGAAAGFVGGRLYLDLQPAVVLGSQRHAAVVGFEPGFVVDVTGSSPRYGGQLTLWGNYAHQGARLWASPIFPFVRAQAVLGMGVVFSGGLMLKLALPVS